MNFDSIASRAMRIYGFGRPGSFRHFKELALCLIAGSFLGGFLGVAIGGQMTLVLDLLIIAAATIIFLVVRYLLSEKRFLHVLVLILGLVPCFLYTGAFSIALKYDRYAPKGPTLVDDCEELRRDLSCTWVNPLTRILTAIRCVDISIVGITRQELKPGYRDLHQQCYGGG